jgi:hypothetical protein
VLVAYLFFFFEMLDEAFIGHDNSLGEARSYMLSRISVDSGRRVETNLARGCIITVRYALPTATVEPSSTRENKLM